MNIDAYGTLRGLCVTAMLLSAAPAWAGRPLVTEDAGVLDRGACEVESFAARERAADAPAARAFSVQLGCGVGLQTQLALAAARERADGERGDSLTLVGKTWLRELGADQSGVTLAYAIGAERAPGVGLRHESTELRAVLTVPHGDWLAHADVGWARSQAQRLNRTTWGVALERTGLGPFDLMGEFFGDDRDEPWANAGARWNLRPGLMFDASYGRQLGAKGANLLTLGVKFEF